MNGQYLCNRAITVSYAFKKEAKGERHGTAAERLLAAQNPLFQQDRPNQMFADMPGKNFKEFKYTIFYFRCAKTSDSNATTRNAANDASNGNDAVSGNGAAYGIQWCSTADGCARLYAATSTG